jgi:hypothetical protein
LDLDYHPAYTSPTEHLSGDLKPLLLPSEHKVALLNGMQPQPAYIHSQSAIVHGYISRKKGAALVHVAPACTGSGKGSNHFGFYVCNISLHLENAKSLCMQHLIGESGS